MFSSSRPRSQQKFRTNTAIFFHHTLVPRKPQASPIMAGGLFGATRLFFLNELEGYDPEFQLYGGEEMEIGFKSWMCHGSIEFMPCSRIGHLFRNAKYWQGQSIKVDSHIIWRNKRRAAAVWMDQYADLVGAVMGSTAGMGIGDISKPLAVRKKLQCRSFRWYLDEIYPEFEIPVGLEEGVQGETRL